MYFSTPNAPRFKLLWLILLGAVIALLFDITLPSIFFFAWQRQDQTWLLYAAARILDGTQLYGPRLVETNPPLIIWLSTLPAWLAIHLHLQPLVVLHSLVTLLLALSSAWSVRILRVAGVLRGRTAIIASFALLLVAQTWVLDVDFAEREHIFDLHTFAPSIVFIEHCDPATHACFALENTSFDTLAWFQRSPAFAAEWRNYHLQQTDKDFDVYARNPSSH